MDIHIILWINAVVVLFVVITETVLVYRGLRMISETLSRMERLSLETLTRLAKEESRS
jgi:hypothetical protein